MDSITEILLGFPGDQSFMSFLVIATIKSSILLLLVLILTKIFSTFSAATKHFIWTATFLILFILPISNLILPNWSLPVNRNFSEKLTSQTRLEVEKEDEISTGTMQKGVPENIPDQQDTDNSEKLSSGGTAEGESLIGAFYSGTITFAKSVLNNNRFMFILVMIWLTGIVVLILKRIMAHLTIYRIYMDSIALDDDEWNSIFLDIMATYKISRPVKLLKNDVVKSPMTWGWKHPKIFIPSEMVDWTDERKRYILLHELAHVKRMDLVTQYIAGLTCIIQWFNPIVWISNKRMLDECEQACDDYVLKRCENPSSYAKLLLEVANSTLKWNYESPVVIPMASKDHLEMRLLSILERNTGRSEINFSSAFASVFGIYFFAIPLIMFSPPDNSADNEFQFEIANAPALLLQDLPIVKDSGEILPLAEQLEQIVIQDTSTIATLTDILYDEDKRTRMQAVEALGKIGTPTAVNAVINSISHKWDDLDDVVDIFSSLRASYPIESLMDSVKNKNKDIRREAIFTLNDAPNINAINALCNYMEDEDSKIREETAKGLGRIGNTDVLPCLIPHMNDENQKVRVEVIEAIGNVQDKEAVSALSEALLKDESSNVREEAADALGAIRDPLAIEPLSMALNDESSDVREEAAEALGKIGDPSAIEFLTNALKQETDNEVRREIINSIGNIYSLLD
ncbi:MAG: M56 family metallopeptidase [Balneolales bacterium]